MVNLLEYFKIYSFRRQFRHQFSTVYHVIFRHHRMVLERLLCKFWRVWTNTSNVINGISVKIWLSISKVIYLDVYSDVNSQSSFKNFAGTIGCYFSDCPVNSVKFERVLLKLLVRLVVNLLEYFKSYSFRRQFRHQFSTVYHVILQAPLDGITATALYIL